MFHLITLSLILSTLAYSNCLNLTTIVAKASLPVPLTYSSVVYDNVDSIYIFGGLTPTPQTAIYKYNIQSDTISQVGSLPLALYAGNAINGPGGIYHFGGRSATEKISTVYKLNFGDGTVTEVATLQKPFSHGIAVKKSSDSSTVFLVDGTSYQCFHLTTLTNCGSGGLLQVYSYPAAFVHKDQAFIFGYPNIPAEVRNLNDLTGSTIQTGLPEFIPSPSAVYDGSYAYLIGGYYNSNSTYPTDGLIRYNPETLEHEFFHVENFPGSGTSIYQLASSVFVEKLNRIYIFGGVAYPPGVTLMEIFYIDLEPVRRGI